MTIDKEAALPEIARSATGITGLDLLMKGGIPRGRITLIEGKPGAGKTLMALQALVHGARALNEPGIFVAFEERSDSILENAAAFGWDLPALQKRKLFFLDAQPAFDTVQSGSFDLSGMLAALDAKVNQIKARRIVFDAIDVVLSALENGAAERRELYRLRDWIRDRRLTTIITSKSLPFGAGRRRSAFMQFMMDCAVSLDHRVLNGTSQRSLRVLKFRGSGFHENETPYLIDASGIDVAYTGDGDARRAPVTDERVSTGVGRLDTMLGGGFFRGASVLVTGAPGTAKTTLAGAFAEAACGRGEPTLLVSFDSDSRETVRNLSSVGIRLGRYLGSARRPGLLRAQYAQALEGNAETHLLKIQAMVRQHAARCVVIDPISALVKPGNEGLAESVTKRLIDWCKERGVTLFCTSLTDNAFPELEGSPVKISTIADTWIHLSYVIRNGERNRALSIIKSRGTAHSNQVRELVLDSDGITLADAYSSGGEVLMGTMRWERERADEAAQREAERAEHDEHLRLVADHEELSAKLSALQHQLEAKRAQLEAFGEAQRVRRNAATVRYQERSKLRHADVKPARIRKRIP